MNAAAISWWQPLVVVLQLVILVMLLSWLALAALKWSLLHSYRSRVSVLAYYDRLLLALEDHKLFWPEQSQFGPYQPPVEGAFGQLQAFETYLEAAGSIAEPLRTAQLPSCSLADIVTLRCWGMVHSTWQVWKQVRLLADRLSDATSAYTELQNYRERVLAIPSDVRAQVALRRYELEQAALHLESERVVQTNGLDAYDTGIGSLDRQISSLESDLGESGEVDPAVLERATELLGSVTQGISILTHDLSALTTARTSAEEALERDAELLSSVQDCWRAIQRRGFREQAIDEVLLGLAASRDDLQTRLSQRSREAFRTVLAQSDAYNERVQLLQADLEGIENSLSEVDANLHTAADELSAAGVLLRTFHEQSPLTHADVTSALYDTASAQLAAASDTRQQGTREALKTAGAQADLSRRQAADVTTRIAVFQERTGTTMMLWQRLNHGDISDLRERMAKTVARLDEYPKHQPATTELQRNIELAQREAELALSYMSAELRERGEVIESQLDDTLEALQYAARGTEYVAGGIGQLNELIEGIEKKRLQTEQEVAMLLYVDLPAVEQLSGSMLVELRETLINLAMTIRRDGAQLLDPSQTEYDQALRFVLPNLRRQLDQVRSAHATNIRQMQLQYEAERNQLARSWAQLESIDLSQLSVVEPLIAKAEAEYQAWQQDTAEAQDNPYLMSQVLGRRSAELDQRLNALQCDIADARVSLKELDKAFQQRYSQANAMRERLRQISASSMWPNLPWDIEADRSWAQVVEMQKRIQQADTLPALLDAWQHALGASTELVKLYERGEAQARDGLGHLQNELKAVQAIKQRVQHQADAAMRRDETDETRKLAKLVAQTDHLIALSLKEAHFDAAMRHLKQAREALMRL
ncbi:MAG: hypothetical protein GXY52_00615 [Chloroflexi bacterium]|nr:hypothetical protein [Chloroflexota bacterium]